MTVFNDMQSVKRKFFAFRNGIIADTLRRNGAQFKIIFGLNLPQIKEIAISKGENKDLAEQLWANSTTRESMMLAPMIYPLSELTLADASRLIEETPSCEIADNLCHSLLRKAPFTKELIDRYSNSIRDMERYIALRLLWKYIGQNNTGIKEIAEAEANKDCRITRRVAMQLLDELQFLESVND